MQINAFSPEWASGLQRAYKAATLPPYHATFDDLRSWKPCWFDDRLDAYLARRVQPFTARDVLDWPGLTFVDRMWVLLRPQLLSVVQARTFVARCARRCVDVIGSTQPPEVLRAVEALEGVAAGAVELSGLAGLVEDVRKGGCQDFALATVLKFACDEKLNHISLYEVAYYTREATTKRRIVTAERWLIDLLRQILERT